MDKKSASKEFKINESISLRLREGKTRIYVGGEEFIQCKYLFIVDPERTIGEEVDSIDQASEILDNQLGYEDEVKPEDVGISPEEMFWGHCSNLQAWVEYDYDTRLLHSNLAFPLLKELAQLGDSKARKVFKEEVVKRFLKGTENTRYFLCEQEFLQDLTEEELGLIIPPHQAHLIEYIEKEVDQTFGFTVDDVSTWGNVSIKNGYVTQLKINTKMEEIPEVIGDLKTLRYLKLNDIKRIPKWINDLKNLRELHLSSNGIEEIIDLKLPKLVKLNLSYNKLRSVDFSGCELPNLKMLGLNHNQLTEIRGLAKLKNLGYIGLGANNLEDIPEGLFELPNLGTVATDCYLKESRKYQKLMQQIKKENKKKLYIW